MASRVTDITGGDELLYSDDALAVLADFNGIDVESMRRARSTASNRYMLDWMEALGARHAAGLPIYSEPGRLLTPGKLREQP